MRNAEMVHFFFMFLAVVLEVYANVLIKQSLGFSRKLHGLAGICCFMAAFGALAQAVKGIDLSVAYALWGGSGILLTILLGQLLFGQRLRAFGWAGALLMVCGMSMLRFA